MCWSINIGNIAGTAVRIHVTFLLFLGWIFIASCIRAARRRRSSLVFMLLLFACVLAHEFGHIFMARAFGVATPGRDAAADRRRRAARAHPGEAVRGIAGRARRARRSTS